VKPRRTRTITPRPQRQPLEWRQRKAAVRERAKSPLISDYQRYLRMLRNRELRQREADNPEDPVRYVQTPLPKSYIEKLGADVDTRGREFTDRQFDKVVGFVAAELVKLMVDKNVEAIAKIIEAVVSKKKL
jgi:hypothetical protein